MLGEVGDKVGERRAEGKADANVCLIGLEWFAGWWIMRSTARKRAA